LVSFTVVPSGWLACVMPLPFSYVWGTKENPQLQSGCGWGFGIA
jgi:hypothetical protein